MIAARARTIAGVAAALLLVGACARMESCRPASATRQAAAARPAVVDPAAPLPTLKIAFLGDSLTVGLGLLSEQSYPSEIHRMFSSEGYQNVDVLNAGVSGDTTAAGLRRVDEVFEPDVRILVVALGGNDALRGISPQDTKENLARIIEAGLAKNVNVVLVGMMAPPNLGADYAEAFSNAFISLATEYKKKITYVPFLLEGVAGNPMLNQADGIHPNPEGAKLVAQHLYPTLHTLVDSIQ